MQQNSLVVAHIIFGATFRLALIEAQWRKIAAICLSRINIVSQAMVYRDAHRAFEILRSRISFLRIMRARSFNIVIS